MLAGRRAPVPAQRALETGIEGTRRRMTNRPAQRWRVAEAQQQPVPSPPLARSTMNDITTAAAANEPPTLPPHTPLSPKQSINPSSLSLPSPSLSLSPSLPSPPPLPAFPLTPLLRRVTAAHRGLSHPTRPFVTLTFAQSLDASLSYSPTPSTTPLLLSSPASLRLTHYLRAIHSAILVGANTLQCDNPSLTCRLIPGAPSPTPIIVEGGGAEVPAMEERKAVRDGTWVVMNERGVRDNKVGRLWVRETWEGGGEGETAKEKRVNQLLDRGCRVLILPCSSASSSHISFPHLLSHLHPHFYSVMVEGGAGVITSLLQSEACVDQLVLTVAPMFIGGWRSVQSRIGEMGLRLHDLSCEMCGGDVILHAFTSSSALPLLATLTASSSASASLSTALSKLSSSFHSASVHFQHCLDPAVSHVLEPYNALVYSSVAFPPFVLLFHSLLRLRVVRRLLPSSVVQRFEQWTRWRTSLLLPALLLLAHYLAQQWTVGNRYSWLHEPDNRVTQTRHTSSNREQEMHVLPASSPSIPLTANVSSHSSTSLVLLPAQPYLLPYTSASSTSRPTPPAPLPQLFSASTSGSIQTAPSMVRALSKASAVLEAIKHNRRQSQNGSGGSSSKRRQQSSKSEWTSGETSDAASEGEAKERD